MWAIGHHSVFCFEIFLLESSILLKDLQLQSDRLQYSLSFELFFTLASYI